MQELPFLHLGIQNIAGSSTFPSSHGGKFAAWQLLKKKKKSVCFSATEAHPGKRDVFVSSGCYFFFFRCPLTWLLGFLKLDIVMGQPGRKSIVPNEISLCFSIRLGASRAPLSSSGGLITVFLNRRTSSDSHLKQIPSCLIPQQCTDELIWEGKK